MVWMTLHNNPRQTKLDGPLEAWNSRRGLKGAHGSGLHLKWVGKGGVPKRSQSTPSTQISLSASSKKVSNKSIQTSFLSILAYPFHLRFRSETTKVKQSKQQQVRNPKKRPNSFCHGKTAEGLSGLGTLRRKAEQRVGWTYRGYQRTRFECQALKHQKLIFVLMIVFSLIR